MRQFATILFFGLISISVVMAQNFGGSVPRTDSMAVYENYGLVYSNEKKAYCFNDKIVGLFVDEQIGKFNHLSTPDTGEIHIKVNREPDGKIISITELTPTEYAKLMEAFNDWSIAFNNQMNEWSKNFRPNIEQILTSPLSEWGKHIRENIDQIPPPIIPSFPWPTE